MSTWRRFSCDFFLQEAGIATPPGIASPELEEHESTHWVSKLAANSPTSEAAPFGGVGLKGNASNSGADGIPRIFHVINLMPATHGLHADQVRPSALCRQTKTIHGGSVRDASSRQEPDLHPSLSISFSFQ
jgi:hypothetical protein